MPWPPEDPCSDVDRGSFERFLETDVSCPETPRRVSVALRVSAPRTTSTQAARQLANTNDSYPLPAAAAPSLPFSSCKYNRLRRQWMSSEVYSEPVERFFCPDVPRPDYPTEWPLLDLISNWNPGNASSGVPERHFLGVCRYHKLL